MDVRVGLWRKLSAEELMLLNCGVGEDSWESLGLKEIQPEHPKGDQSWVFFGRTDVKTETPILWPPDVESWLIGKNPDAGRDWGQEEKGTTEDEMAGWHHRLDGDEFGWTPGDGDGQGGLVCCNSWGGKELDTTEQLNWTDWLTRNSSQWLFFRHWMVPSHAWSCQFLPGDLRKTSSELHCVLCLLFCPSVCLSLSLQFSLLLKPSHSSHQGSLDEQLPLLD